MDRRNEFKKKKNANKELATHKKFCIIIKMYFIARL